MYQHGFSAERTSEILRAAGFTAVDFPLADFPNESTTLFEPSFEKGLLAIRDRLAADGIRIGQTHLPYIPSHTDERLHGLPVREFYDTDFLPLLKRGVELSGSLGSPYAVIHLQLFRDTDEMRRFNLWLIGELLPVCESCGVTLAVENIFNYAGRIIPSAVSSAEDQLFFINSFKSERLAACLDTGHAMVLGLDPLKAARTLGKHLCCLHLNSNDGTSDLHMLPYSRGWQESTDWYALSAILGEIGYSGTLSLELSCPPILPSRGVEHFYRAAGIAASALAEAVHSH